MTKNLTPSKPPATEELDLESFLRRHNATSDEDEENHQNSDILHRTVDDILNDSSSDSDHDALSVSSSTPQPKTLISSDKQLNSTQFKYNLIQRFKSDEIFGVSSRKPLRNQSIFGRGVSRKPGAALAAAAAASRNVRMPRAAGRRALSVNLEGKVSDGDEYLGFVRDDVKSESVDGDANVDEVVGEVIEEGEKDDEFGRGKMTPSFEKSQVSDFEDSSVEQEIELREKDVVESIDGSFEKGVTEFENVGESERQGVLVSGSEKDDVLECQDVEKIESEDFGEKDRVKEKSVIDLYESSVEEGISSSLEVDNEVKEEQDIGFGAEQVQDTEKSVVLNRDELDAGRDEVSSISDDAKELVEGRITQLESEIDDKRAEEKLHPAKKQLELAEELEIKQASTGQDWEEGAAAQPMRLEGVRRSSTVLGYFDVNADNTISRTIKSQAFIRDYGTPQAIAVHLNYIALGMSKGVIVVVPCKYSAHHPDDMDPKMLLLGAQADRSQIPVTSICFNQQGDLLLAGYGDGHITLWNVPRGTVTKVITGEHFAPVVHTLFLRQDFQVTRQFKIVTGDCKGLVKLHELSSMPIVGFTVNTQFLLDGQRTDTVLCASPLLPDEFTFSGNNKGSGSNTSGIMGGVGGAAPWKFFNEGSSLSEEEGVVIFVTHQTALVVRLKPKLEVYAQFSKPKGIREGSMPYTAWKYTTQSKGSSTENLNLDALERTSLLAIAWDRKVQVAKLIKSEIKDSGKPELKESKKWKLEVCGEWTLESAAIGLAWLDDQMLVILTLAGQLYLFTRDGTLIHQTSYASNETEGDDLISYHTYFTNLFGNPEKAYHNCLAVRGASVYILSPKHVVISRLLLWRERIEVLRNAGDWMGAFNMAMTLYDGQAHGVIDLPRDMHAMQEAIMPYLVQLLLSYVDEVFSYISVAFSNQIGKEEEVDGSLTKSNDASSEIKEQFTRVGGVAVEFSVHIRRTDILFNEIFSKFVAVQHRDTFLELLEPYILKDMLGSLPPEIMQALVEHYNGKGWLQRVEQCILHMDISSLDFNQVVRLCRENGLYGALIYLFNKGLDDFKTPLEELLNVLRNPKRDAAAAAAVGYRMLVYLKYCFSGLAFPPGRGKLPSERLPSLTVELLQFLLQDSGGSKSQTSSSLTSTGAYLNLHYLLELDTEATLDVLRISLTEDEHCKLDKSLLNSPDATVDNPKDGDSVAGDQDLLVQKIVNALVIVLDIDISQSVRSADSDDTGMVVWPSKKDIGHLIEFVASYVASKRAIVTKSVLSQILEYLMSENHLAVNGCEQKITSKKRREKKVLALLNAVPQTEWNASYVLHLCEKAQFHQVCGLIHTTMHNHVAALDSYMKDVDEPVHVFSFIDNIFLQLSETESSAFQSAIISRIPDLVILSRECTFCLVMYHFNKERRHLLSILQPTPRSLFLYLKTLLEVYHSGTLNVSCVRVDNDIEDPWGRQNYRKGPLDAYLQRISEFPKVIHNYPVEVNDDIIELYLELLCQYEPDSVLKFLETFESYRVDRCLLLCQKYGIVDAAAFLLERVGDVGSALLLTLSGLNDKFVILGMTVESTISELDVGKDAHIDCFAAVSGLKEVQDIKKILHACIGLCQRNSPRLGPDESESLWFHLLDSFCRPLLISQGNSQNGMLTPSSNFEHDLEVNAITWTVYRTQKCAPVLKGLFSHFVKEIVEGMIGYVRLPSIMEKLLSDNGSQEFGDFKLTILGMLETYSFERRILDTAKCLIEDDTFYTMSLLKKGASKGYAPRSLQCCICSCSIKSSSSSGIRVFNCGHVAHLQCDVQENVTTSQSSPGGCPICVHKKKMEKAKGKMAEQGLVSASPSTSQRAQGTNILHPHELDAFENSTGPQISRFEILSCLQKNQRLITNDTMPQLRLAPPAVYHEKVNKRTNILSGSSREGLDSEKTNRNRQLQDLKVKGSSIRFPLKSKIFGKEKTRVN